MCLSVPKLFILMYGSVPNGTELNNNYDSVGASRAERIDASERVCAWRHRKSLMRLSVSVPGGTDYH